MDPGTVATCRQTGGPARLETRWGLALIGVSLFLVVSASRMVRVE
jgi:hypothetical protein